tara:strand:+ start:429 stop:740 length:312 start_codon:yes stop_codon:yes gene_type:complete
MKNSKQIDGELGPDNAEARDLMNVLHRLVDTSQHTKLDLEDIDEEFTNTGVGKDTISKYSFAILEAGGKEYLVQVRDKKLYDQILKGPGFNKFSNTAESLRIH